jgi:hypothetical protein
MLQFKKLKIILIIIRTLYFFRVLQIVKNEFNNLYLLFFGKYLFLNVLSLSCTSLNIFLTKFFTLNLK